MVAGKEDDNPCPKPAPARSAGPRRWGSPKSQVVRAKTGGYFIAPRGLTRAGARRGYADCRAAGGQQSTCAAVAHRINKRR
jgi:hypothetical protein